MTTKLVRNGGKILNARVLFRDKTSGTSVSIADGILFQDGKPMNKEDIAYWACRFFELRSDGWYIEAAQKIVEAD